MSPVSLNINVVLICLDDREVGGIWRITERRCRVVAIYEGNVESLVFGRALKKFDATIHDE
jgi:hypothetical protein